MAFTPLIIFALAGARVAAPQDTKAALSSEGHGAAPSQGGERDSGAALVALFSAIPYLATSIFPGELYPPCHHSHKLICWVSPSLL